MIEEIRQSALDQTRVLRVHLVDQLLQLLWIFRRLRGTYCGRIALVGPRLLLAAVVAPNVSNLIEILDNVILVHEFRSPLGIDVALVPHALTLHSRSEHPLVLPNYDGLERFPDRLDDVLPNCDLPSSLLPVFLEHAFVLPEMFDLPDLIRQELAVPHFAFGLPWPLACVAPVRPRAVIALELAGLTLAAFRLFFFRDFSVSSLSGSVHSHLSHRK